jgi:hypothetical protein
MAQYAGTERRTFPALFGAGLGLGVILIIVAFLIDGSLGWGVVVLVVVAALAAVGYRAIAGSSRSDADSSDPIAKQPLTRDRPLGDTPEAHDEINVHDIPVDAPERHSTERLAGGSEGTTRGPVQ